MIDRRLLKNLNYQLLLIMFILCFYGLLVISSASQGIGIDDSFYYVRKQIIGISIGLVAMIAVLCIDYINYYRWSWYLYACNLIFWAWSFYRQRRRRSLPLDKPKVLTSSHQSCQN